MLCCRVLLQICDYIWRQYSLDKAKHHVQSTQVYKKQFFFPTPQNLSFFSPPRDQIIVIYPPVAGVLALGGPGLSARATGTWLPMLLLSRGRALTGLLSLVLTHTNRLILTETFQVFSERLWIFHQYSHPCKNRHLWGINTKFTSLLRKWTKLNLTGIISDESQSWVKDWTNLMTKIKLNYLNPMLGSTELSCNTLGLS